MARDGSGTYALPVYGNPVVTATTLDPAWANGTLNDIAAALTGSVSRDGQSTLTGALNFGGFKAYGLGAPTVSGDAIVWGQAASVSTLTTTGVATLGGSSTVGGVLIASQSYVTSQGFITNAALTPYAVLASAPTFTGLVKGRNGGRGMGQITIQNGGTPTNGADGDIAFVY